MITFITSNPGKAKYLSTYFHYPVAHRKLDLPEIQSLDLKEIVIDKAQRAYKIVKKPVLVEDVSLTFEAIKPLPGPLIKWFLIGLGNDGICALLKKLTGRKAIAEIAFAYCDKTGTHVFTGKWRGSIAQKPMGKAGFGWDPIFIPEGYAKTWAQMSDDEKRETSMRKIALKNWNNTYISNTNKYDHGKPYLQSWRYIDTGAKNSNGTHAW